VISVNTKNSTLMWSYFLIHLIGYVSFSFYYLACAVVDNSILLLSLSLCLVHFHFVSRNSSKYGLPDLALLYGVRDWIVIMQMLKDFELAMPTDCPCSFERFPPPIAVFSIVTRFSYLEMYLFVSILYICYLISCIILLVHFYTPNCYYFNFFSIIIIIIISFYLNCICRYLLHPLIWSIISLNTFIDTILEFKYLIIYIRSHTLLYILHICLFQSQQQRLLKNNLISNNYALYIPYIVLINFNVETILKTLWYPQFYVVDLLDTFMATIVQLGCINSPFQIIVFTHLFMLLYTGAVLSPFYILAIRHHYINLTC